MALRLTAALAVLLTFAAELSFGSKPKCRMTSSQGWASVQCDGRDYGKELAKLLAQPPFTNISHLTLSVDTFPSENRFHRFTNLTHLKIQAEDIANVFPDITGLHELKSLNLSSNRIRELPDMTNLSKLENLNLSNNSLEQVDFNLLPSSVQFLNLHRNIIKMDSNVTLPKSLKRLDLSKNRMIRVLPMLSETMLWLNLSENNITELSFILSLVTAEEIDLSRNNITRIDDDTFSTLSSLVRLDLSRNFIKCLKEKSFSGLNRLQIIDLSQNLLQSITPGTFQYLSNLLWLNLANNINLGNLDVLEDSSILLGAGQKLQTVDASRTNLTKVPNTLTRSIRNLYLSSNRISTIRCGDLDSFLLLQFLDLTSNNISIVEDDALGRLELLYYLLLAENSLTFIPHSLPDNLLVLDLDRNRIENLTFNDLVGLSRLRTLRLAWNRVTAIQDGAFGQLSSLQNLDLSGNPVKILSGSTFVGPRRLIHLSLASLTHILPTNDTLSFPVPESSHLQILNLENSPALAVQLLNDVAALSMFRNIKVLILAYANIRTLRDDLVNFLPRLEVLDLRGSFFNCNETAWLSDWLRRLQEETSDSAKLQLLEDNSASIDNQTDLDIAQDITAYADRLKMSEDVPKCASPVHLAGVSLYELKGEQFTTPAAKLHTTRTNFNIRKTHDHEFYQNDFPSIAGEKNGGHKQITPDKASGSDKRQVKTRNTNGSAVLESGGLQKNKHNLNQTLKFRSENFTDLVEIPSNRTFLGSDNIKAEYLTTDNDRPVPEIKNKTTSRLEDNKSKNVEIKTDRTNTDFNKLADTKGTVMYSPLDITSHDANDEKSSVEPSKSDEGALSVSSPQKISVEDSDADNDPLGEDAGGDGERYTHHPGLLLFFVAAGILGIAVVAMKASQRRQSRRGYAQQQDIEVRSLDLSAQELW